MYRYDKLMGKCIECFTSNRCPLPAGILDNREEGEITIVGPFPCSGCENKSPHPPYKGMTYHKIIVKRDENEE